MKNKYIYFEIWDVFSIENTDYVVYEIWQANGERTMQMSSQKEFKRLI